MKKTPNNRPTNMYSRGQQHRSVYLENQLATIHSTHVTIDTCKTKWSSLHESGLIHLVGHPTQQYYYCLSPFLWRDD